jgi:hypothetical protein
VPAEAPREADWLRSVYASAVESVVLIDADAGSGTGFCFHDPRLILTALHVVEGASEIVVQSVHGQRTRAAISAYSRESDLALLKLERAFEGMTPLQPEHRVEVGDRVAIVGHPFSSLAHRVPQLRGLLNWSLSRGVIGAVSIAWLQTDAAVNPGVSGGPVLNEQGRVLGVVSARLRDADGIGMVSRIRRAELLLARLDQGPPPPRLLRLELLELAFLIQWTPSALNGAGVGAGWRVLERYPLQARLGYLAGAVPPETPTVLHEDVKRLEAELTLGYALPLSPRLSLSAALGASVARDHSTRASLRWDGPTTCAEPPCLIAGTVIQQQDLRWRAWPLAGLNIDFVPLRLGYAFEWAPARDAASQHRVLLGLIF